MQAEDTETRVLSLMRDISTMTLATSSNDVPWATDVYFANMGYDLLFFSSINSRHCRNLEKSHLCAATIHPVVDNWTEIRGIQIEGSAQEVEMSELPAALSTYFRKFSFAKALFSDLSSISSRLSHTRLYLIRSRLVYYLDNSIGFGTKFYCEVKEGQRVSDFLACG